MNRKLMYLLLCVLGIALPYSQFIPWTAQNGLHMKYFVQQLLANRVGGFFGLDHCKFGEDSYLWLQLVDKKHLLVSAAPGEIPRRGLGPGRQTDRPSPDATGAHSPGAIANQLRGPGRACSRDYSCATVSPSR